MKQKSNKFTTVLLLLLLLAGLALLLYPTFSNYWNTLHQTRAITGYTREVFQLDGEVCNRLFEEAQAYNRTLLSRTTPFALEESQQATYGNLLDLSGQGIMGYIEIPAIDCTLPIYHGSEESVLQIGVGHLEWSSLPVGGESTHCVLSGHRGLPSARLFTNLDKLREGDVFYLKVLDRELTYQVDQILIVEPQESSELTIREGEDLCTLVTCTPYGINTHRLLVRGRRVEETKEPEAHQVTADATRVEPLLVALALATPILLVLLLGLLLPGKKHTRRNI